MSRAFERIGGAFSDAFDNKSEIDNTKKSLDKASDSADDMADNADDLEDKSKQASTQVKNLGDSAKGTDSGFTIMKGAISNLIAEGLTKLIALAAEAGRKVVEFGQQCVEASAEVSAENSSFDQIMGDFASGAQKKMEAVASATGVVSTRLTGHMTSITAKFKGLGYDTETATTMAAHGLTLASDAAAFWDKSLDDSTSALNSFLNGSYEGGEAIGLFANDTQMAAYAVEQGVVSESKAWANLDEATKQATRLEYAQNMMEMSGATGQAAKESENYANVQANLSEKWRQFKANVGEPILQNFVIPAMEKLSEWVGKAQIKFEEIKPKISEFKDKLGEAWEKAKGVASFVSESFQPVLDALKGAWDNLKDAISPLTDKLNSFVESGNAASTAMSVFQGVCNGIAGAISLISSVVTPVISTISATIAEHLPAWQERFASIGEHLEKLKPILTIIGGAIASTFASGTGVINGLVSALDGVFQWFDGAVEWIGGILDLIVGLFTGDTDRMKEGLNGLKQGAVDIFGGLWNAVSGYVSGFVDGVIGFFDGLGLDVSGKIDSIKTNIVNWASGIWESIKSTFSNIYNTVADKIGAVKDFIADKVDWLKGCFDFDWHLPDLKLPHFSVSGEFSLNPLQIPSFGIDWYADGAILTQPTVFGMNPDTGAAMVGGEAGAEAVAPIAVLQEYVGDAVRSETGGMQSVLQSILVLLRDYFPQLLAMSGHDLTIDGKKFAEATASYMDTALGKRQKSAKRGVVTA